MSDNPPTAENAGQYMTSFGLIDSRSKLKEPYSSREAYAGYALGVSMMRVPVSAFQAADGTLLPLNKTTLAKAMKVIHGMYSAQQEIPATLSYMGQGAQAFGALMEQAVKADKFVPNPSIFEIHILKLSTDFHQTNPTIFPATALGRSTWIILSVIVLGKLSSP